MTRVNTWEAFADQVTLTLIFTFVAREVGTSVCLSLPPVLAAVVYSTGTAYASSTFALVVSLAHEAITPLSLGGPVGIAIWSLVSAKASSASSILTVYVISATLTIAEC